MSHAPSTSTPRAATQADAARTFDDLDPATGECIAKITVTTPAELDAAVARARAAQPAWEALGIAERCERLARASASLERRASEIADLAAREMGKVRGDALRETRGWAEHLPKELEEVTAALAPTDHSTDDVETKLVRVPHGVVAVIAPWNFPVAMPLQMLAPALAAGNTVVFKPSEHVPLTGAAVAECIAEHLPTGVLELVQGEGDVGARLVEADVDMIAFTGSRDTGIRIMSAASPALKRLVLELGGKDPLVVFADADLDAAAECAVKHSLRNTGQVCCSVERVYVDRAVAPEFERRVTEKARAWRHGSPFEDGVSMGPLVSAPQREKVVAHVEDAVRAGARLVLGGTLPDGPGAFYPATVLADVPESARVSREETFGPVVSLSTFDGSEDEAVRLANDTPYGLGASVFSGDLERAQRVAERMRAGQVGVNRYLAGGPGTPWVGARQSGFGFLGGPEGHRQFTVPKTISRPRRR